MTKKQKEFLYMGIRFLKALKKENFNISRGSGSKKNLQKHRISSLKISFFRNLSQQQLLAFFPGTNLNKRWWNSSVTVLYDGNSMLNFC